MGREEHLLVYVRYLNPETFDMFTQYLCTIHLAHTTAPFIVGVLEGVLKALGIHNGKVVAFCSDGAATFVGRKNGVGVRLQRKWAKFMVLVHCCAHRSALVMSGTSKANRALRQTDSVLVDVHRIFNKSSKRQASWEAFAKCDGITVLKFPIFNATRWFSRALCLRALLTNVDVFVLWLEEEKKRLPRERVDRLLRQLKNMRVLAQLFVLHDLI